MKTTSSIISFLLCLLTIISCKPLKNEVEQTEKVEIRNIEPKEEYSELNDSLLLAIIHTKILEYPYNTEFSIAAVKNGTPYYYGVKNNDGEALKLINHKNVFEIGSITKTFTTDLLAKSVIEGKLNLENNISDVLGMELHNSDPISLAQLASHSSGLPVMPASFWNSGYDEQNPYVDFGKAELIHYLENEISVDTSLINKFSYSNMGMSILGYVLEEVHQKDYETLLQEKTLTPLKMSNTSLDKTNSKDKLVMGLKGNGELGQNWDLDAINPAGGLYSTTEDLVKYIRYCYAEDNKSFALQAQPILNRNKSMDQALGWMIINSKSGKKFYCHAGGTGGYSSILVMNTDTKNAIVLLSNIETEDSSIDLFGFKLMKELNAMK